MKKAQGWIESLGYAYQSASSKNELDKALVNFTEKSDSPQFLEVFTTMEDDARITKEFYNSNRPSQTMTRKIKGLASKIKRKIT
jgi:hypothetical protein